MNARLRAIRWLPVAFLMGTLLHAQTTGPMRRPDTAPGKPPRPVETPETAKFEPPPIPVEEIIRQFAAKETEFKAARDNYTYRQSVRVQELGSDGDTVGEYRLVSDIIFTPEGKRIEKVVRAPLPTLQRISVSPEDLRDIQSIQPFVMATADIPKYNIEYLGKQRVDELDTYLFRISPKVIQKGERYFEGLIWVDDRDLQIVKTLGKAVPDIRSKGQENLFPRFETYREQVDGRYWFPTYTSADDTLFFKAGPVRVRMVIRYTEYKRYGVEIKVTPGEPVESEKPEKPEKPEKKQ